MRDDHPAKKLLTGLCAAGVLTPHNLGFTRLHHPHGKTNAWRKWGRTSELKIALALHDALKLFAEKINVLTAKRLWTLSLAMPEQIDISDSELQGFTPQGRLDLVVSITAYKTDLLKEIGRIEAGQNAGSGVPEITSRMVKDAEIIFSRGSIFQRRRSGLKILKTIAVLSLFVAGAMVQKDQLKDFTYLLVFLVVLIVAITTNILVHLRD